VAALFSGFSLVALAQAAAGLFSVVSYSVAQRTNEFGIRMALGATRGNVLRIVFGSTARHAAGGLACGILLSLLGSRVLAKWRRTSIGFCGCYITAGAHLRFGYFDSGSPGVVGRSHGSLAL
jgi:ABC-type antimicrobial peptide transport system permease subunit